MPGTPQVAVECWEPPRAAPSAGEWAALAALAGTLPTILATSRSWAVPLVAHSLGLAGVLAKPYDLDALVGAIWRAVPAEALAVTA